MIYQNPRFMRKKTPIGKKGHGHEEKNPVGKKGRGHESKKSCWEKRPWT